MDKKYRNYNINIAILTIILFFMVNGLYYMAINYVEQSYGWLEDKYSKPKYLANYVKNPDVIFIGSSRTQNHINTNHLSNNNIHSLNFGVPNLMWEDYESVIERAIENVDKYIIISIPPQSLFLGIPCPKYPDINDVIHDRYKKCPIINGLLPSIKGINKKIKRATKTDYISQIKFIRKEYQVNVMDDKREIYYIRGGKKRKVVIFKNGDGVVFSNRVVESDIDTVKIEKRHAKYNPVAIKYIKYLADKVRNKGKEILFIIEPMSYEKSFILDIRKLSENIGVKIIDNNGILKVKEYWSDEEHLSYKGTKLYAELLLEQLKNIVPGN